RQFVERRGVEDAGVAHDCVDAAEALDGRVHDRLPTFGRRHRVVGRDTNAPGLLDFGDDLFGDGGVGAVAAHRAADVVDHHECTSRCQVERVEAAETAPGTGDDDDLAGEVDHGLQPNSWSKVRRVN